MFVSLVYVATVALLPLHSFVYASPLVTRAGHGTWNPPITAPQAGDIWTVGSTQFVTWNTDRIPPSAVNKTGALFLGFLDGYATSENLDIHRPLAYGFPLIDGCVSVQVPDVKPRDTYIVVLMGNSGNASPEFTITNPRSIYATTHRSSSSPDKVISQENYDDLNPNQLPPEFPTTPVSPIPPLTPDPPFSDPEIDPIETESFCKDSPAPALCRERHPSSKSGAHQHTM